jgi:hypothetical protein
MRGLVVRTTMALPVAPSGATVPLATGELDGNPYTVEALWDGAASTTVHVGGLARRMHIGTDHDAPFGTLAWLGALGSGPMTLTVRAVDVAGNVADHSIAVVSP